MVCADCEKKAEFTNRSVICPDPWKDGSRNSVSGGAGRSVGENKLLSKKRGAGANPYDIKCQLCKQRLHDGGIFCQDCAYSKGLCRLCGKVVLKGREFYKSFYSEENEKKFAPKKRDASEVMPEGECAEDDQQPSGAAAAAGDTVPQPVKKVKKVKKSDGSDASKAKALQAAAEMKDFILDNATGMYFNAKTQQYYDATKQLYYTYNHDTWYYFDTAKNDYVACAALAPEPAVEEGPVAAGEENVVTATNIAAEICAAAGPGSMPLEVAKAKAKEGFTGLRAGS